MTRLADGDMWLLVPAFVSLSACTSSYSNQFEAGYVTYLKVFRVVRQMK